MADLIASHPSLSRVGLGKIVESFEKKMPGYFKQLGAIDIKTTQAFERMASEGDFPVAPVIGESTAIPMTDFAIFNERDYYWVKRALGYAHSTEKWESDQYGILNKTARKLAKAMNTTEEIVAHNVLNLGFTSVTAADGLSWFNVAHTLDSGVNSNRGVLSAGSYVDVALSYEAINQAQAEMALQKGHRGNPMPEMGPFKLIVNPRQGWIAKTLVNSAKRPTTGDNDDNVLGGTISSIIQSPYLSSSTAWFLLSDRDEPGFFKLNFRNAKYETEYVKRLDRVEYMMTQIYGYGVHDWRGAWGTTG
jgi:hypothetical protein